MANVLFVVADHKTRCCFVQSVSLEVLATFAPFGQCTTIWPNRNSYLSSNAALSYNNSVGITKLFVVPSDGVQIGKWYKLNIYFRIQSLFEINNYWFECLNKEDKLVEFNHQWARWHMYSYTQNRDFTYAPVFEACIWLHVISVNAYIQI